MIEPGFSAILAIVLGLAWAEIRWYRYVANLWEKMCVRQLEELEAVYGITKSVHGKSVVQK